MSIPSTTQSFTDTVGTYYLSGNYTHGPYYLFRVEFRTNYSSGGELGNFSISVIATNADPRDLAIASYSVVENGVTRNYSDIFVKVNCGWPRLTLTRLSAPDVGSITYYNSYEGVDASSRIAAYTGINGSGAGYASYELHSLSEYTYVNYGALTATYLPLSGGTINAGGSKTPLILKGGVDNYGEGLRINPATNNWATILLGGNDSGESIGTSPNSWSIHNNNGKFYISKNGSDYAPTKLSNTDGTWRVNDKAIVHESTPGVFTLLNSRATNVSLSLDKTYLVIAYTGPVRVYGENSDYGSSGSKTFSGVFMVTVVRTTNEGEGVYVNTQAVFSDEYLTGASISGSSFKIYELN